MKNVKNKVMVSVVAVAAILCLVFVYNVLKVSVKRTQDFNIEELSNYSYEIRFEKLDKNKYKIEGYVFDNVNEINYDSIKIG